MTALETDLNNMRSHVVELLAHMEENIDRDNLRLLLHYSRKLSIFQKRATLVQECLDELLANGACALGLTLTQQGLTGSRFNIADDDLSGMYLTAKLQGKPRAANDHEEVELLLEAFSKQCEEVVSEVETLAVRRFCSLSLSRASHALGASSRLTRWVRAPAGQRPPHGGHRRAHPRRQPQLAPRARPAREHHDAGTHRRRDGRRPLWHGASPTPIPGPSLSSIRFRVSPGLTTAPPDAPHSRAQNLTSHLESHPFAFPLISLSTFAFAALITSFGLRRLAQLRRVGLGWRDEVRQVGDKWVRGGRARARARRRD